MINDRLLWIFDSVLLYTNQYVARINILDDSITYEKMGFVLNGYSLANCQTVSDEYHKMLTYGINRDVSNVTIGFQLLDSNLIRTGLHKSIPNMHYRHLKLAHGGRFVVICGKRALLIDMYSDDQPKTFLADTEWVGGVDLSVSKGQLLTGGNQQILRTWDIDSGGIIKETIYPNDEFIQKIVIDTNSNWVVTVGSRGGEAILWDLNQLQEVHRIKATVTGYNTIVYSKDSHLVAISSVDKTITVVDTRNLSTVFYATDERWLMVPSMAFSPNNRSLAIHSLAANILQIIDLETKQVEKTINLQL